MLCKTGKSRKSRNSTTVYLLQEWEKDGKRDYYCSSKAFQWDQHESSTFFGNNNERDPKHQEHLCTSQVANIEIV